MPPAAACAPRSFTVSLPAVAWRVVEKFLRLLSAFLLRKKANYTLVDTLGRFASLLFLWPSPYASPNILGRAIKIKNHLKSL